MGLHIPGTAFINPGTALRDALTRAAGRRILQITALGASPIAIGEMLDERSFVNAIAGLLATGGSTNHTMHLVAMARAAGIQLTWDDFADLSAVVPLLARIYPNGSADVNHFHAAGGLGFIIRELLDAGLLHEDVGTIMGPGLRAYTREPWLDNGALSWREVPATSLDDSIVRPVCRAFSADGGLKLVQGNMGRAVIKTSAVPSANHVIEAPAAVFDSQAASNRPSALAPWTGMSLWSSASRVRVPVACQNCTNSSPRSVSCRIRGIRLRWSPMVVCPAPLGKCQRLFTSVPNASLADRLPNCEMATSCVWMPRRVNWRRWWRKPTGTRGYQPRPMRRTTPMAGGRELFRLFRQYARTAEEGGSALL